MNGFAQNEFKILELNVIVASAENKKLLKDVIVIIDQDSLNKINTNKRHEFELTVHIQK